MKIVADPNFTAMYGHGRPPHKDRSTGRGGVGGGVPPGLLSRRPSTISPATHRAGATEYPSRIDGGADAGGLGNPGNRPRRGLSDSEWQHRQLFTRVAALDLPPSMTATLAPLRSVIELLNAELTRADETFAHERAADPVVARLTTLPGIGPITASAYVAALDDATRFGGAAQVASYLGLVDRVFVQYANKCVKRYIPRLT